MATAVHEEEESHIELLWSHVLKKYICRIYSFIKLFNLKSISKQLTFELVNVW